MVMTARANAKAVSPRGMKPSKTNHSVKHNPAKQHRTKVLLEPELAPTVVPEKARKAPKSKKSAAAAEKANLMKSTKFVDGGHDPFNLLVKSPAACASSAAALTQMQGGTGKPPVTMKLDIKKQRHSKPSKAPPAPPSMAAVEPAAPTTSPRSPMPAMRQLVFQQAETSSSNNEQATVATQSSQAAAKLSSMQSQEAQIAKVCAVTSSEDGTLSEPSSQDSVGSGTKSIPFDSPSRPVPARTRAKDQAASEDLHVNTHPLPLPPLMTFPDGVSGLQPLQFQQPTLLLDSMSPMQVGMPPSPSMASPPSSANAVADQQPQSPQQQQGIIVQHITKQQVSPDGSLTLAAKKQLLIGYSLVHPIILMDLLQHVYTPSGVCELIYRLHRSDQPSKQEDVQFVGIAVHALLGSVGLAACDPHGSYFMRELIPRCATQQRLMLLQELGMGGWGILASDDNGVYTALALVQSLESPKEVHWIQHSLRNTIMPLMQSASGSSVLNQCLMEFTQADSQFIYEEVCANLMVCLCSRNASKILHSLVAGASNAQLMQLMVRCSACTC